MPPGSGYIVKKEGVEEQKQRLLNNECLANSRAGSKGKWQSLLCKKRMGSSSNKRRAFFIKVGKQVASPVGKASCAFFSCLYGRRLAGGQFGKNRAEQRSGDQQCGQYGKFSEHAALFCKPQGKDMTTAMKDFNGI